MPSNNGLAEIRVRWFPNNDDQNPGSHFFVKYKRRGESQWLQSAEELNNDTLSIKGLEPDENFEFRVVSVDGLLLTESATQEVDTYGIGE